jgi:hypothetical protein
MLGAPISVAQVANRAIHGEQFEIVPISAPEFSWTMSVS